MIKAYYVIRKDLGMSAAKLAVQVGHGTQLLMRNSDPYIIKDWEEFSDSRKIVCEISSEEKLNNLFESLVSNKVKIVDSGYTEFDGKTFTGIAFFIDDTELPNKVKRLQLYKS